MRRLETLRSGTACLALLRNAQEHADPPHRHLHPKVGDEVEFFGTDKGVEATDAEFANPGLERIHLSRAVNTRLSRPRWTVWMGGSSKTVA